MRPCRVGACALALVLFVSQGPASAADPHTAAPEAPAAVRRDAPPLSDHELARRVDAYVRSFADTGLFSGIVLVRRNGRTVSEQAYGVAERRFGAPVARDTRFMIASLSKPITAAAVARLVDEGKVSFDDPISRYVPNIPNGDKITIDQLLTHHSGLDSPDRQSGSESWMRLPNTTEQLVERARAMAPAYKPGERYFYANANYWILANLIERVSGVSYGDFLDREIFQPLGMKDSGHRADVLRVIPRLADGYAPDGVKDYRVAELIDWTSKTGNGSLYSTADDFARFYDALAGGRLLKPETTRRVFGEGKPMGYGWFHRDDADPHRRSVWFNGRSPGYTAVVEAWPDAGTNFIILSNLYVYSPTVMADGLRKIVWNEPYALQQPIRPAAVSPQELRRLEGTYQFGPTFFVRNGRARIVSRGDHLDMQWEAGGLVTTLIPLGQNVFFDPTFWATIRFEPSDKGWRIRYRAYGFDAEYEAAEVPAS